MGTAPDSVKRLVDRFDQNRDATDRSQLTAYSLRPPNSGPSAVSRKPMAYPNGQVYEQFLGKVIKLTDGHRAKVEEKPEVRKAGGVHYTPQYIVNYIVKNTVGKLAEYPTHPEDFKPIIAEEPINVAHARINALCRPRRSNEWSKQLTPLASIGLSPRV